MFIAAAIIGLIVALAAVPINTNPLLPTPHPAAEYTAAVAKYDTLQEREKPRVMPDGASLIFVHGQKAPRAIILVHGLTNSPRQFRELGKLFYDRGYNVIVPRMPRHGLKEEDIAALATLTAEKYRDYADNAVDIADGLGDSVFVMGLSGGGNVAAWIAQNRPDVKRVVVISPALTIARIPSCLDGPAMNIACRLPNVTIRQKADPLRRHAYFGVSTKALGETLRFGASIIGQAETRAPAVSELAMVTNANDHTIDASTANKLVELWNAHDSLSVKTFRFSEQLGLPHDVIDVTQHCGMPSVVYPALIALMERQTPDSIVVPAPKCPVHQPESGRK